MALGRFVTLAAMLVAAGAAAPAGAEVLTLSGDGWQAVEGGQDGPSGRILDIRRMLADGEYSKAEDLVDQFITDYERTVNEDQLERVFSLRSEILIARKSYWDAYESCEDQLKRFPGGKLVNRALAQEIHIAAAYLDGALKYLWGFIPHTARGDALDILQRVRDRAGASALAIESLTLEADYHVANEDWDAAYDTYLQLRKTAVEPDIVLTATLKAADAAFNAFEGIYWDDTPLLEAEQLYKSYLAARPDGSEAEYASARMEQLRQLRAEKDFAVGGYYERTATPVSALFYYRQVVETYPDTGWAEKARVRIAALSTSQAVRAAETE